MRVRRITTPPPNMKREQDYSEQLPVETKPKLEYPTTDRDLSTEDAQASDNITVLLYTWFCYSDCPMCNQNARAEVRPQGVAWPTGDYMPPIHKHCNCELHAIDEVSLTEARRRWGDVPYYEDVSYLPPTGPGPSWKFFGPVSRKIPKIPIQLPAGGIQLKKIPMPIG